MNPPPSSPLRRACLASLLAGLAGGAPVLAAPGAHGPDGEHLDEKKAGAMGSARPRLETSSEQFELVATLHTSELSVLIDRYATNEPVLNGKLEVESGGVKAVAAFHAEQGDYAFDDPKLLAVLWAPGEHALVFTLTAGAEADLLDGTLVTSRAGPSGKGPGHDHGAGGGAHGNDHTLERVSWAGAGVLALGLLGGAAWWRRRRREPRGAQGVQP